MKKLLTIVMAAALLFAAASQASAAALETKGEFRGRYWYLSDYAKGATNVEDTQDFFDSRLRLGMNWQVSENVKVAARADILENIWDITAGTNDTLTAAGAKDEIDFDHAYAQFGWGPTTVSVGKMDVTWGLGTYAAADNRYRFRIASKFGQVPVAFALDNLTETFDTPVVGDRIGYSLGAVFPLGANQLGVLGLIDVNRTSAAFERTFYAVVPYFKGTFGAMKVNAELAWGTGEDDWRAGGLKNRDIGALFGYAGLFIPVGAVNIGVEGAYSKGDDAKTTNENEGVVNQDYQGPFSSFILFNNFDLNGWVSQYSAVRDPVTGAVTNPGDWGVTNAMALKGSATWAMSKQLSLMGAVVWAQADEKNLAPSEDMGVEFDALAKYALTENVTVQAGFGYLAAGDYFGKNVDDPWVGTVHTIVSF